VGLPHTEGRTAAQTSGGFLWRRAAANCLPNASSALRSIAAGVQGRW
jgi:hypothetical protein